MPKSKGQTVEPSHRCKDILRWTDEMDQVLLNALSEEVNKGNKHDGSWTTEAYSNMVDALRSAVAPSVTKQHIKNRMKTLKDHFNTVHDLFKSLSGFAWNPTTRRFEAGEEVWLDLLKVSSFFTSLEKCVPIMLFTRKYIILTFVVIYGR